MDSTDSETEWGDPLLRQLLAAVPTAAPAYGPWWGSRDGRRLATAIRARIALPVVAGVRRRAGRRVDRSAVLGLVVEALAPPSQLLRGLRSPMTDHPIGYLVRSLVNSLVRETGTPPRPIGPDGACSAPRPRGERLDAAIRSVTAELDSRTPERLRSRLQVLIERIVDRATDGALSRLHTQAARDAELHALGWEPEHIRALVNAVIGPRPDHSRASLIAGFLAEPAWRPTESPAHLGALECYARRMLRAETRLAASRSAPPLGAVPEAG